MYKHFSNFYYFPNFWMKSNKKTWKQRLYIKLFVLSIKTTTLCQRTHKKILILAGMGGIYIFRLRDIPLSKWQMEHFPCGLQLWTKVFCNNLLTYYVRKWTLYQFNLWKWSSVIFMIVSLLNFGGHFCYLCVLEYYHEVLFYIRVSWNLI